MFVVGVLLLNNIFSENWSSGVGKLYTVPDSIKVGIGISAPIERLHINNGALKIGNSSSAIDRNKNMIKIGDANYIQIGEWEADDMLSFKASKYNFTIGNIGIGVANPQYKLDIAGKMFLRTVEWKNSCAYSYLNWQSHKLVMGVPKGTYAVTKLDLMSGGCSEDSLYSELVMYTAYDENNQVAKIKFNTMENCWINTPGFIGIGTQSPRNKLDVRGTIRADAIYVNVVSGADFVFDTSYSLRSLSELKDFVLKNKHLPEIPSEQEMKENGVDLHKLQILLLQKIEELTLYIIEQEQRIQELEFQTAK